MGDPLYIRGPRMERTLKPAHLRSGRSILRSIAGIVGIAVIGFVGFAAGYPNAAGTTAPPDSANAKAASVAGSETKALSERTRPDWLAKLASAPNASMTQDGPSGLESAALADKIEAAVATTGSIAPPRKAPGYVAGGTQMPAPKSPASQKPQVAAIANPAPPQRPLAAAEPVKPQAARPRAAAAKKEPAAPASGSLTAFFRRPGLSTPLPPPDPAR